MNNVWVVLSWIVGAWANGVWAGNASGAGGIGGDGVHETMDRFPRTMGARGGRVRR